MYPQRRAFGGRRSVIKVVGVTNLFVPALEIVAQEGMEEITDRDIGIGVEAHVDVTINRPDAALAHDVGGWLPKFISVFKQPRLTTRSAASIRSTIGGALISATWTPMNSGWSIGNAPLPSTVVSTGTPIRSASATNSRESL